MLLEKLKKMFSRNEKNGKKKVESMVVFVIILVFTIVAINYIWNGDEPKRSEEHTSELQSP